MSNPTLWHYFGSTSQPVRWAVNMFTQVFGWPLCLQCWQPLLHGISFILISRLHFTAMLPFLASVIRPPFLQAHNSNSSNILEQTQAFIRLVCQHKQQQLILQQQQQQHQWTQNALKRRLEMEEHHSPTPPKRTAAMTGGREETASQNECANWTVEEVCQFVASVELCKPYVEVRTILRLAHVDKMLFNLLYAPYLHLIFNQIYHCTI